MEIEQVRKLKEELEDNILDLLVKFEQATDTAVADIGLHMWPVNESCGRHSTIKELRVTCEV